MANRFVLNTISYHGSGAIKEIPGELQRRGYKKVFVCSDPDLAGVSPRGTLGLLRCVKAYAYLQGRTYVIPDDVRTLAVPVLAHRLVCGFGSDTGSAESRMEAILADVPVPTERFEP